MPGTPGAGIFFRITFVHSLSLLLLLGLLLGGPGMSVARGDDAEENGEKARAASDDGPGDLKVTIELLSGEKIEATLLKRDDESMYVDIGGSPVRIDQRKVKSVQAGNGESRLKDVRSHGLYRTARRSIKAVQALVEELGPAIVLVKTPVGSGTGWFINDEGYLITNNHVISGERSITVTMFRKGAEGFEKKVYKKVRIIALNDDMDLALLKIEEPIDIEYEPLHIGDSDALEVGDRAFAVGNPLGLERSTSEGIVSKVARNFDGRLYIQTTAPIAPGNSGGPLFNERGEVVGVVNMGYIMLDGLGFAIPSKYVREFLDNVEAFAYDEDNPNSGTRYMEAPVTSTDGSIRFVESEFFKVGHGASNLLLADLDGTAPQEVVFANNNKAEIGILRRRTEPLERATAIDFEEINRLPPSERFRLDTVPVRSAVSSMAVADVSGDDRPDIVFYGDIDKLAVMEQKPDGSFERARRIDDFKVRERRGAIRVADMDGNGRAEILALGDKTFAVFRDGSKREEFPLGSGYVSSIKEFELLDADGDGRRDIVFFVTDRYYAVIARLQNAAGRFVEERPIAATLSGPVTRYHRDGTRFLALDKGLNRIHELTLSLEEGDYTDEDLPASLLTLQVDPDSGITSDLRLADIDGDGRIEALAVDREKNEYVVYRQTEGGFRPKRSPSLTKVGDFEVFVAEDGRAAAFSLSEADKIFGVSRIAGGKIHFPRPINTEGEVEDVLVETLDGTPSVLWVEKIDGKYHVRRVDAADLVARVHDGGEGSIDIEPAVLTFGSHGATLPRKPDRLAFADFNADGRLDLVIYWSYSGRQSLYVGTKGTDYEEIIGDQKILEEQKDQPLVVEDIDGDGKKDVLLVQPGFVRVLRVDDKRRLYVKGQYNWPFGSVRHLALYDSGKRGSRFLALSGDQAEVVRLDPEEASFEFLEKLDLSGLEAGRAKVADVDADGRKDIIVLGRGAVHFLLSRPERLVAGDRLVFNAKLDHFSYWNLHAADLDTDGTDEVMLFDSAKAMFEIYRPEDDGELDLILRHRLFEKTITQREEASRTELPQELVVGDVNGGGKPDVICILQDRVAVYFQEAQSAD